MQFSMSALYSFQYRGAIGAVHYFRVKLADKLNSSFSGNFSLRTLNRSFRSEISWTLSSGKKMLSIESYIEFIVHSNDY